MENAMARQRTGRAVAAGIVIALLSVAIETDAAVAGNSEQKVPAAQRHHAYRGHRLYNHAAPSSLAPRGNAEAARSWYLPPTQDPRDAWDGYFAIPDFNPIQRGSQGL